MVTRTSVPESTVVPEPGSWVATRPARPLASVTSEVPFSTSTRLAFVIEVFASPIVMPLTLGTVAGSGPSEIHTVMVSSLPTTLPASGSVLVVNPAAMSGENSWSVTTFVNPACASSSSAASADMPEVSGTSRENGPFETTRSTSESETAGVPPDGF